jgi:hypothetical protein
MKRKTSAPRIIAGEPERLIPCRRNIPVDDLFLHARSFHRVAQALAGSLLGSGLFSDVDFSPVVFMYRHALELSLKALLLGGGGNFLATKPDPLSVIKTHSVSWLSQFVCQIVTVLKWEPEFRCVGIESLDDFRFVVEELNSADPGSHRFRLPGETEAKGSLHVRGFVTKMDALLALLDATADALAAEWDLRSEQMAVGFNGDDGEFGPTIQ